MLHPGGRSLVPILLCIALPLGELASAAEPDQDEVVLVGPLTRDEIERAVPDWIEEEIAATPDVEVTQRLLDSMVGVEVTVFMGTWCEDSRRELARLWRGFDAAGALSPDGFRYVGVDRDKQEPQELVAGLDLRYVPTIIVKKQGDEVGRIVEEAPDGIEHDLLALLSGEKSGLVTARTDL